MILGVGTRGSFLRRTGGPGASATYGSIVLANAELGSLLLCILNLILERGARAMASY
jgi:hypothetical protein